MWKTYLIISLTFHESFPLLLWSNALVTIMIVPTVRWCSCTLPAALFAALPVWGLWEKGCSCAKRGFIFVSNENNKKRELELNSVSAYTLLRSSFVQKGQGIISVLFRKEPRFLLWLNTRSHKSQREERVDEEEEELVKKRGDKRGEDS